MNREISQGPLMSIARSRDLARGQAYKGSYLVAAVLFID